jgi:hypothetical protein
MAVAGIGSRAHQRENAAAYQSTKGEVP